MMQDPTRSFSIHEDQEAEVRSILTAVYDALKQKGYNPINQIVGYLSLIHISGQLLGC